MRIDILTLFPSMFSPLNESMIKRARDKGLLSVRLIDIREFTEDKRKSADDTPYGGGAGMVMKPEPVFKAIREILAGSKVKPRVILTCPQGEKLSQEKVKQLSGEEHIIIICGHYEGIDERVKKLVTDEISIGDFVLTGGELPAMILTDAIARFIPGVVKEESSVRQDSFFEGLLDYPCYTKPLDFEGEKVPGVLLSGNHADVARWRRKEALRATLFKRPEFLAKTGIDEEDRKLLKEIVCGE